MKFEGRKCRLLYWRGCKGVNWAVAWWPLALMHLAGQDILYQLTETDDTSNGQTFHPVIITWLCFPESGFEKV